MDQFSHYVFLVLNNRSVDKGWQSIRSWLLLFRCFDDILFIHKICNNRGDIQKSMDQNIEGCKLMLRDW